MSKKRVVFMTGAVGGLGQATIEKFGADDYNFVLLDLNKDRLQEVRSQQGLDDSNSLAIAVDVSDQDQMKEAVQKAIDKFGRIDILLNLAGIPGPSAYTEDYKLEDFIKVYKVNVLGTYLAMQCVLPYMKENKSGLIINIGSVSGMFGYPYEIGYGSSKAAIIHMTKNVANENGGNGVRANVVSPGWIDTNMMKQVVGSYADVGIEDSSENVTLGPMGRPATALEIANVIFFLCSEDASFMNGSNVLVDGGMTLG